MTMRACQSRVELVSPHSSGAVMAATNAIPDEEGCIGLAECVATYGERNWKDLQARRRRATCGRSRTPRAAGFKRRTPVCGVAGALPSFLPHCLPSFRTAFLGGSRRCTSVRDRRQAWLRACSGSLRG